MSWSWLPREPNDTPVALRRTESSVSSAPWVRSASCPGVNNSISWHLRARVRMIEARRRCVCTNRSPYIPELQKSKVKGWSFFIRVRYRQRHRLGWVYRLAVCEVRVKVILASVCTVRMICVINSTVQMDAVSAVEPQKTRVKRRPSATLRMLLKIIHDTAGPHRIYFIQGALSLVSASYPLDA